MVYIQLKRFIKILQSKVSPREFLIIASILVGISAGLAAVVLKTFVHYIHELLTFNFNVSFQNYIYLIFPLIGLVLTTFIVNRFFNGKLGRGTANIIRSIVKKSGFLPKDQMYSHVITSSITVGFGGSAGLESPIVTTGSSIGSNFARTYHLIYKDRILLLACGAAAGIAAAFNAPIAGVLFALEVLLVDASISAFIPLIISAASGALLANIILGESILLNFDTLEKFNYYNVPYYAFLGILCGIISVYYSRMYTRIEHWIKPNKTKSYSRAVRGGLILLFLILVFPTLFGEGYESIKYLATDNFQAVANRSIFYDYFTAEWMLIAFIGLVMLFKVIAAAVTIGSGGNGGNFAPSLFVGAYLGYTFSKSIQILGITNLPITNFTLVGMAGILTGVFHAPLTGIFLIAEITSGYELMIPLMLVSALSYTVVKYFEPMSMDSKKLAQKGDVVTTSKDATILSSIQLDKIMEQDMIRLSPDQKLGEFIEILRNSKQTFFPVVLENQQLVGIIELNNVIESLFNQAKYDFVQMSDLMSSPKTWIQKDQNILEIMKQFEQTTTAVLPVIDQGKFIGFIHKNKLLEAYRDQLLRTTARI